MQMDRLVLPPSSDELAVLLTMHLSSVSGTTPLLPLLLIRRLQLELGACLIEECELHSRQSTTTQKLSPPLAGTDALVSGGSAIFLSGP